MHMIGKTGVKITLNYEESEETNGKAAVTD